MTKEGLQLRRYIAAFIQGLAAACGEKALQYLSPEIRAEIAKSLTEGS